MGVDVGANGGIAIISSDGSIVRAAKMPETDADILAEVSYAAREFPLATIRATIEKVHSSPQMGVKSAFSFGGAYRALRMALTAAGIPFDEVSPAKWQRALTCLSGGDKNVTKQRAQQLFPGPTYHITHAIADALLIAEYGRRMHEHDSPQAVN